MTPQTLHPITERVLAARGITATQTQRFLDSRLSDLRPPHGLAGLSEAVACLAQAVRSGRKIGIFGDYDADGVSAAAILSDYLGRLGVPRITRVAERSAGYGFGVSTALELAEAGADIVVTLDCGTSDHEALATLRARGIDTIVVDHHQVPTGDSPATALVNPHRQDASFPFRGLCSAGLAFYLCAALRTELGRATAPDVCSLLDLVAVGTIADVVPLVDENRILVTHGLRVLGESTRPGLRALCQLAELGASVRAQDVAFRIGPRLNAPGRLGHADAALQCLLADDAAAGADWARQCDERNRERQAIQEVVQVEAFAQAETDGRPFLLLAAEGWHPGVVGIVAQKVVERFGRPAAVVALEGELGRGSARTIDGLNLYELLGRFRERFVRFGGHAQACGFTIDAARLPELRDELARATIPEERQDPKSHWQTIADAELAPADLAFELARDLERLEPFGAGNAEPLFLMRGMTVHGARVVGGRHLQLRVGAGDGQVRGIGFGLGGRVPSVGARIDAVFHLEIDEWQGQERLQMRLRDWWP